MDRRHRGDRQPHQGCVGPGGPVRQHPHRSARGDRTLLDRGVPMSVTAVPGFVAAGIAAGIKASGAPDLSLVATADGSPVDAAGVFTRNKMTAAPVIVTRAHLESS